MKIIINTKNLDLTEARKSFTEEKFLGLKKYIDILKGEDAGKTLAEVFIDLEKETQHHKKGKIFVARAQVRLPGRILTITSREDDLYKAVVLAKDEMKLEIEKYKFKKIDKTRRQQRKAKDQLEI